MIEFLAPWFLAALGAAAVPLLIHLMRRRIGRRVEFPAVRYLARAEREHSRRLRLRNLLLMLLRVAAVLFVALAAARPVARIAGTTHAPTALALVLDNSMSTAAIAHGAPVLDGLKARARQILGRATATDRVWLVTADGVVHGGPRDAVRDALDRVEALGGAGSPPGAAARGAALASASGLPDREVAILTDGQATTWREPVALGDVHTVVWRTPGDPAPNRAVIEAAGVPPRWTPRGAVQGRVLAPDSVTYRIALEGRTLARGTAARDEEIAVRASPAERGWVAGSIEIEPDELRADDTRWFAVWIGPAPGVAVDAGAGPFARSAVDALVEAERAVLGGDVTIAPADAAAKLPALLIAPADPVRVGAANRVLERLGVPWRLGALRRGEALARGTGGSRTALEGVSVTVRYALEGRGGAPTDTLATAAGEPWIVGGPGYVLVASPLVPDATTFPVRAAFVPWVGDVISQRLGPDAGALVTAVPLAAIARPPGVDALEMPGGQPLALTGDTVSAPARAGVYFFLRGGARAGALVVDPEPDESQLARLAPSALGARLSARKVDVLPDTAAVAAAVFASAPRRPLAAPLLVLAIAALVAESVVAGGGRRSKS